MGWDCNGWWGVTNCPCHTQWARCSQYGSTCRAHLCNVRAGGVISASRPINSWEDNPATKTTWIKMSHINELRLALSIELNIRSLPSKSWSNPGDSFNSSQWSMIKNAINECRKFDNSANNSLVMFSYSESYEPGEVITSVGINIFRNFVNILQQTCICNCNYDCACNCNYCPCNCNYCTCNGAYSCTCNCAYSDKRLKEDIELLT